MFVQLSKFAKITHSRLTVWYINYTSVKVFKKRHTWKLQRLRDQEDYKAICDHGSFSKESFMCVQHLKKLSSRLCEDQVLSCFVFSYFDRARAENQASPCISRPKNCTSLLVLSPLHPCMDLKPEDLSYDTFSNLGCLLFPIFLASALWPASNFLCSWPQFLFIIIAPP